MKLIADLEVHSKYARAVSQTMNVPTINAWAKKKGINLVGSGDFTHPMWLRELESNLEEAGDGIYKLKNSNDDTRFLLTSEISCIYKDKGKGRRIHCLFYLPTFADIHKFNSEITKRGGNLFADGRPIVGIPLHDVAQIALTVNPNAIIIPAHVWTPWFGYYGKLGGYNSLDEGFRDLSKYVKAIETGLSSDPAMNWRIGELSDRQIVSFGDAHSPTKLGREATAFELDNLSYENIRRAICLPDEKNKIDYTIEFYPEEGKYHYTGHAKCGVVYSPNEARKKGLVCPVCGKSLTGGVMSRVEQLASLDIETQSETDKNGVRWIKDKGGKRSPYIMLVPLQEIISEVEKVGVTSKKVIEKYESLVSILGSEFDILIDIPLSEIEKVGGKRLSESISKVRNGDIVIEPGYDGIFGKVKIWKDEEKKEGIDQSTLF